MGLKLGLAADVRVVNVSILREEELTPAIAGMRLCKRTLTNA